MKRAYETWLSKRLAPNSRFGRLVVISEAGRHSTDRTRLYLCRCDCGTELPVMAGNLRNGNTKSCGCLKRELARKQFLKGDRGHHPLYVTWRQMLGRCYNERHDSFKNYGGRGIRVCARWRESFWDFVSDVGERPLNTTLDRINNNGHYEPTNTKWSSQSEQTLNTRRGTKRRRLSDDSLISVGDMSAYLSMSANSLGQRLRKAERALWVS